MPNREEPAPATPEIIEFIRRVESLRKSGGVFTVINLFPDLAGKVSDELAGTTIADLIGFDLLAKAPATWVRAPPIGPFEGQGGDLLAEKLNSLIDGLRDFNRVRMMVSPGSLGLLATGLGGLLGDYGDEARTRIRAFVGLEPQRILPAGSFSHAMFQEHGVFEEQVNAWATSIHAIAEGWYLPLLKTAVDLAHYSRNRPPGLWRQPLMLGGVMAAGRRAWMDIPMLNALLLNEVRIIRNARAHYSQELDLEAETVSFVTVSRGEKRLLGPLSKDSVTKISVGLVETCAVARSALEFLNDDDVVATFKQHGLFTGLMRHLVNPLARRSGTPTGPEYVGRRQT